MKKGMAILLSALLLTGCGASGPAAAERKTGTGLRIVTTIFPEYDWVRQILGDTEAELTLLLGSGVDMHSYQPTAEDLVQISTCDLFIYVGGESDRWVADALKNAGEQVTALNLLDLLGDNVREEELAEGMEEEEEEEEEAEEEEEGTEYDEHVWLSLRNAALLCREIARQMGELDETHRETYSDNAESYIQQLEELDRAYEETVADAPVKTLLFGDRFPFRYLIEDYGLRYYAAFAGCSAETEASFKTVVFLAGKLEELGLPAVLTIDKSDGRIARTIIDNTSSKSAAVLTLNSLQSVSSEEAESGASYLGIMEENLEVLRQALQ